MTNRGMNDDPVSLYGSSTIGGTDENLVKVTTQGQLEVYARNSPLALGDSCFTISTNKITLSGTGTEYPFLLFDNPNSSGKVVRVINIWQQFFPEATAKWSWMRLYRDPTVTANGTALTILKGKKNQSATSVISAYKVPTITSVGSLIRSGNLVEGTMSYYDNGGLFIDQNEKVLCTIETSTGNRDHIVSVLWSEDNP